MFVSNLAKIAVGVHMVLVLILLGSIAFHTNMWKEILITAALCIPYTLIAVYDLDCTFYGSCNVYGWLKGICIILVAISLVVLIVVVMIVGTVNSKQEATTEVTPETPATPATPATPKTQETQATKDTSDTSVTTAVKRYVPVMPSSINANPVDVGTKTSATNDVTYAPVINTKSADPAALAAPSVLHMPVPSATATVSSAGTLANVDSSGYMLLDSYTKGNPSTDLKPHTQ